MAHQLYDQQEIALKVAAQPQLARYTLNDGPKTEYCEDLWGSLEPLLFDYGLTTERPFGVNGRLCTIVYWGYGN